jgi:hypothetical protein
MTTGAPGVVRRTGILLTSPLACANVIGIISNLAVVKNHLRPRSLDRPSAHSIRPFFKIVFLQRICD